MRAALSLAILLLLTAACRREADPALIERHFLPGTEYTITAHMRSERSLHVEGPGGELRPMGREQRQEMTTRSLLRVDPATDGICPVELEVPLYRVSLPDERVRVNLTGCLGLGRYETATRRLDWEGIKDSLWSAPAMVDSGWTVQVLPLPEAAAYLHSTMLLLGSSLSDSTRRLMPGQGWREESRQETMIGQWPVAWRELRTVTLRTVVDDLAIFDVKVELEIDPPMAGATLSLEGEGSGRIDFDLRRRFTAANLLETRMTIEVVDSSATWIARSATSLDIRTASRLMP
jgi:hypothetical protein